MRLFLPARLGSGMLAMVLALSMALVLMSPHRVYAGPQSGIGNVYVYPNAGGAGASVTLNFDLPVGNSAIYSIYYTTTKPDPQCIGGKPLPVSNGNTVLVSAGAANPSFTFSWPTLLAPGIYYFCLRYESPATPGARQLVPFPATATPTFTSTVTPTPTRQPTATPTHSASPTATHASTPGSTTTPVTHFFAAVSASPFIATRSADPTIVLDAGQQLAMGASASVTITHWTRTAPQHVWVVGVATQANNTGDDLVEVLFHVTSAPDASGMTKVQLSIPATFDASVTGLSDQVMVIAGGTGIMQRSDPVSIANAPQTTPTASIPTVTPPTSPSSGLSLPLLAIGVVVAAMVLIGAGLAVILSQRRGGGKSTPSGPERPGPSSKTPTWWGEQDSESTAWEQFPLPGQQWGNVPPQESTPWNGGAQQQAPWGGPAQQQTPWGDPAQQQTPWSGPGQQANPWGSGQQLPPWPGGTVPLDQLATGEKPDSRANGQWPGQEW